MAELAEKLMRGEKPSVPYTLDDMADDAIAVMDETGMDRAHIVGASMGGMIVQTVAIRHPGRLRSMTSIMSTTGNPDLPRATPEAMAALTAPPATNRDEAIARAVNSSKVIGSQVHLPDPVEQREFAGQVFDRSFNPMGVARQMAAVTAHGNRKPALANVTTPTLVLHGREDPLVPVTGGIDTWEAIPGADLLVLAGMGHDLPKPLWPRIVRAITELTERTH
jgi:pimeloyl-ACP methyl ester carboxylesterase